MENTLITKLEELKKFRTKLNSETTSEFDQLIESIKKDLPEPYKSKLNTLKFYEYYEDPKFDDLPF